MRQTAPATNAGGIAVPLLTAPAGKKYEILELRTSMAPLAGETLYAYMTIAGTPFFLAQSAPSLATDFVLRLQFSGVVIGAGETFVGLILPAHLNNIFVTYMDVDTV